MCTYLERTKLVLTGSCWWSSVGPKVVSEKVESVSLVLSVAFMYVKLSA